MSKSADNQLTISQPAICEFNLSAHRAPLILCAGLLKKVQGWMLAFNSSYQLRHLNVRQLKDIGLTSADRERLYPKYPSQATDWARI